jgi:hypothetical protein
MDSDQELVSWLGVALLLLVIWQVYRAQIMAILFNSPAQYQLTPQEQAQALAKGFQVSGPTTTPTSTSGSTGTTTIPQGSLV